LAQQNLLVNKSLIIQVILLTALIMMIGLMLTKEEVKMIEAPPEILSDQAN